MSKNSTAQDLKAIQTLADSRGWKLIADTINAEILAVARGLGSNPEMQEAEMHFRRGVIYAMDKLLTLPPKLISSLTTAHLIESAKADTEKKA